MKNYHLHRWLPNGGRAPAWLAVACGLTIVFGGLVPAVRAQAKPAANPAANPVKVLNIRLSAFPPDEWLRTGLLPAEPATPLKEYLYVSLDTSRVPFNPGGDQNDYSMVNNLNQGLGRVVGYRNLRP